MSESAPRRRWFQFGLGAIVWLMTLVAFAVMTISSGRQQVRLENEIKELRAALREVHEKQASESKRLQDEIRSQRQVRITPLGASRTNPQPPAE